MAPTPSHGASGRVVLTARFMALMVLAAVVTQAATCPDGAVATLAGDPHMVGADGDQADFKGEDRAVYNILSAANVSFQIRVVHDNFTTPFSKLSVRGSWIHSAYSVLRTASGRLLRMEFNAVTPSQAAIHVYVPAQTGYACIQERLTSMHAKKIDNVVVSLFSRTLTIEAFPWRLAAESTRSHPHFNKLRMNVGIQLLSWAPLVTVAPHGILGQTFDGDGRAVDGRRDTYARLDDGRPTSARTGVGGTVSTRASAEGAIEGAARDYRMSGPFATAFRFTRFDARFAAPRNVSKLGGRQRTDTRFRKSGHLPGHRMLSFHPHRQLSSVCSPPPPPPSLPPPALPASPSMRSLMASFADAVVFSNGAQVSMSVNSDGSAITVHEYTATLHEAHSSFDDLNHPDFAAADGWLFTSGSAWGADRRQYTRMETVEGTSRVVLHLWEGIGSHYCC
jgi:hypothetical protein